MLASMGTVGIDIWSSSAPQMRRRRTVDEESKTEVDDGPTLLQGQEELLRGTAALTAAQEDLNARARDLNAKFALL